jgi:hypothetical protein
MCGIALFDIGKYAYFRSGDPITFYFNVKVSGGKPNGGKNGWMS